MWRKSFIITVLLSLFLVSLTSAQRIGSSRAVLVTQELDDTDVVIAKLYVGNWDARSIGIWFKADENTGTVDVGIERQWWVMGAGWAAPEADGGGWAGIDANNTTDEWNFYGTDVASTSAFETPGWFADSMAIRLTGNAGNGSNIDVYLTISGKREF